MKKQTLFLIVAVVFAIPGCNSYSSTNSTFIAEGQMPYMSKDNSGNVNVVYGSGDSILYSYSLDKGNSFSSPVLIAVLPNLASSHMRGPQIAATLNGVVVTACNSSGNIFSYASSEPGHWSQAVRVNDVDTTAKENLIALSAEGNNVFSVWLDLREGHNEIYGAKSTDGGKSWSNNTLVYASPDTTVCECCKPSVAIKGNNVFVMFRNWLNGNRDLYLIQSADGGKTFGEAQKLGKGNWALNGCPMDGGGLIMDETGNVHTVWNRKGEIYSCEPGREERKIGEGKTCTIESVNGKNVYAWVTDGNIIVMNTQGVKKNLGPGQLPIIKAVDNKHVLCMWEKNKEIHKTLLEI